MVCSILVPGCLFTGCQHALCFWFGKILIIAISFLLKKKVNLRFIISCNLCIICSCSWSSWPVALWSLHILEMHLHPRGGLFPATGYIHLNRVWVWGSHCEWLRMNTQRHFLQLLKPLTVSPGFYYHFYTILSNFSLSIIISASTLLNISQLSMFFMLGTTGLITTAYILL